MFFTNALLSSLIQVHLCVTVLIPSVFPLLSAQYKTVSSDISIPYQVLINSNFDLYI